MTASHGGIELNISRRKASSVIFWWNRKG
jgi:hypothetical protein